MLQPIGNRVVVEPIMFTDVRQENIQKKIPGFQLAKPDNKSSFEGIPNQCRIVVLPQDYEGPLQVGKRYVMKEMAPKGFKNPDNPDQTLFVLDVEQIIAEVTE